MTLIGDHNVEGVDRDIEALRVLVQFLVTESEGYLSTKEVDGHPLDSRHVHEGMARLGVGQVGSGQHLWIKLLFIPEVFAMESLAVDLVHLIELQARFRLKGSERPDGLSG
jgi:hypothetical protein